MFKLATGRYSLEAFSVDNGWAAFVVFLLCDPHLLEGGKGSQDGSSDPYGVFSLRWSNDFDLDGGWSQGGDFLLHSVGNTRVHGGATRHDSVGVQVLTDVNIALHDRVVGGLMDTAGFHSQERGLEESLGATESLIANGDDLTVGKLIGLLEGGGGSSSGHFLFKVQSHIAELLLDVADNLTLSGGGERVASLSEDLHEVVSEISTSEVKTEDGVGEGITFIDGDGVGDTITRVKNDTSGTARGIEGEDSLDGDIHGRRVEGLKHDLGHLLAIGLGVKGSLSQEDGVLLWGHAQLVVEGVVPDLLHVVPVGDDSMLNGILQSEDTPLGLGLVSNIGILLSHTHHHALVTRASHNRGENSPGGVVSGKSSLAHAGAIVDN